MWLIERLFAHALFFLVVLVGEARYKYVGQGLAVTLLLGMPILALIAITTVIPWWGNHVGTVTHVS